MKSKIIVILFVLLIILGISTYVLFSRDELFPWNKQEAINVTLSWAGLQSLPSNSKEIRVLKKGSIFTRQFIIELKSDSSSIKNWINSCKLKDYKPSIDEKKNMKFEIYPGEKGSTGGFILINIEKSRVTINMSWS